MSYDNKWTKAHTKKVKKWEASKIRFSTADACTHQREKLMLNLKSNLCHGFLLQVIGTWTLTTNNQETFKNHWRTKPQPLHSAKEIWRNFQTLPHGIFGSLAIIIINLHITIIICDLWKRKKKQKTTVSDGKIRHRWCWKQKYERIYVFYRFLWYAMRRCFITFPMLINNRYELFLLPQMTEK